MGMGEPRTLGSKTGSFDVNTFDINAPIKAYNKQRTVTATKYNQNNSSQKTIEKPEKCPGDTSLEIKVYKRRYIMLVLFAIISMMNGFPQFQYTVVADVVACYYKVTVDDINWTCVVFMVAFLPLVLPVMYLMDKKGLKVTLVIGAVLNCIGSWVQCNSFAPNRFPVVMACQTIYALGQVFVLSLPPFLAGVWFGAGEVGLACALGVFGNQLGVALGFIVPPSIMVNDCKDEVDISKELSYVAYTLAAINTLVLFIVIFVFQEKPAIPPSMAQAAKGGEKDGDTASYGASLKALFVDVPFVLLFLGYGLITGTYFTMSTLMNEMVLIHFPGEEVDAGWLGAIMVFAGMVGSVILGALLDKTRRYKSTSLVVFVLSFLLLAGYTVLIRLEHIWIQFLFFTLLGLLMTGYLPAGFDFAAEITYPESEAMSGSLLNAATQIFSIVITNIASPLLQRFGDFSSNTFMCACLLLGTIVMAMMKVELKRTNADKPIADVKPE